MSTIIEVQYQAERVIDAVRAWRALHSSSGEPLGKYTDCAQTDAAETLVQPYDRYERLLYALQSEPIPASP